MSEYVEQGKEEWKRTVIAMKHRVHKSMKQGKEVEWNKNETFFMVLLGLKILRNTNKEYYDWLGRVLSLDDPYDLAASLLGEKKVCLEDNINYVALMKHIAVQNLMETPIDELPFVRVVH